MSNIECWNFEMQKLENGTYCNVNLPNFCNAFDFRFWLLPLTSSLCLHTCLSALGFGLIAFLQSVLRIMMKAFHQYIQLFSGSVYVRGNTHAMDSSHTAHWWCEFYNYSTDILQGHQVLCPEISTFTKPIPQPKPGFIDVPNFDIGNVLYVFPSSSSSNTSVVVLCVGRLSFHKIRWPCQQPVQ